MTIQEMADKILEVIQGCGSGASFVDIENACGDEAQGNLLGDAARRGTTRLCGAAFPKNSSTPSISPSPRFICSLRLSSSMQWMGRF